MESNFLSSPASRSFIQQLLISSKHNKDDSGVESTRAKLRARFWVPRARKVIRSIISKDILHRKKEKILCTQEIGQLPALRLQPSPPFLYSAVDLIGPLIIKDMVKKRTREKGHRAIFNGLATRAVYIDLADRYDTDGFILVLRRFISVRVRPAKIRSDLGLQLVADRKKIKLIMQDWNWDKIHTLSRCEETVWDVNELANASWENGCSKKLIKQVKKSLILSLGTNILTFSDL